MSDEEAQRVIRELTMDRMRALQLARAGHELYTEIMTAISETMQPDGSGDYEGFTRRLNESLTKFTPRDFEIRRMLESES